MCVHYISVIDFLLSHLTTSAGTAEAFICCSRFQLQKSFSVSNARLIFCFALSLSEISLFTLFFPVFFSFQQHFFLLFFVFEKTLSLSYFLQLHKKPLPETDRIICLAAVFSVLCTSDRISQTFSVILSYSGLLYLHLPG